MANTTAPSTVSQSRAELAEAMLLALATAQDTGQRNRFRALAGFVLQKIAGETSPSIATRFFLGRVAPSLRAIEHPDQALTTSADTGRLYHPVSSCPKDLRRFLLIDGRPTAEVDISASQFYLLLSLYGTHSEEWDRFGRTVTGGLFYEHLCKLLEHSPEAHRWGNTDMPARALWSESGGEDKRGAFKVHAFRSLLYGRLHPKRPLLWQRFEEQFTELAGALAFRRRTQRHVSDFSCEMQRTEAGFMFDRVLPRLSRELPACLPVTIHDSILCQARFAEDVRRVMREEGESWLGVAPAVGIKWGHFAESARAA
jgi:hypothetical protein